MSAAEGKIPIKCTQTARLNREAKSVSELGIILKAEVQNCIG